MSIPLLPRLKTVGVSIILENSNQTTLNTKGSLHALDEHSALLSFAASGGNRAGKLALDLSDELREIAKACGFPNDLGQLARANFDQKAAIYLAQGEGLDSGEALRDDVWAFLTTVMAPDLVAWRFPDRALHRFEGGVRNAFQRLWIRGKSLDRGEAHPDRWQLIHALSEDAMVQIFERPSIGSNRTLALSLAEGWFRTSHVIGKGAMEDVMRRATKLLRLKNEIVDLASLSDKELFGAVSEIFDVALTV